MVHRLRCTTRGCTTRAYASLRGASVAFASGWPTVISRVLVVGLLTVAVLLSAAMQQMSAAASGLTPEQKMEDFEYLYRMVSENYPFLWVNERVNGIDWLGEKDSFRRLIEKTESDAEFRVAVGNILSRLNNGHTHILHSQSVGAGTGAGADADNVTTAIIEENRVAYIRVRSFSSRYIEQDRQRVLDFLSSISHYPNLLIDIRGNGGGSESYWRQLLVAPLISEPIAYRLYLAVRSGDAAQDYMKSRLGAGYYFLQVGRGNLPGLQNVPSEVFTEHFTEPIQLPDVIFPRDSVGFRGQIILLVDEGVYSSSESFAVFAKATGWATLVGTPTGGDGIGFDPMVFMLPNSEIAIRMAESMGINPDGTANEEAKTAPDVLVDINADRSSSRSSSPRPELDAQANGGMSGQSYLNEDAVLQLSSDPVLEAAIGLCTDEVRGGRAGGGLLGRIGWAVELARGFGVMDIGLAELTAYSDYSEYEGREVAAVEVYGAYRTDESLVRQTVGISPGDRFSSRVLGTARQRLLLTNALRSSALLVRPTGDGRVTVVVFIQEGWSLYLGPRDMGERLISDMVSNRISLNMHNVGGRLINVRAVYAFQAGGTRSVQVDIPVVAGRLPLRLSVVAATDSFGAKLIAGKHAGSSFTVERYAYSVAAQTAISPSASLSVLLSHLTESVRTLSSDTGLLVQDGSDTRLSVTLAGTTGGSGQGLVQSFTQGSAHGSAQDSAHGPVRSSIQGAHQVSVGVAVDARSGSSAPYGFATAGSVTSIGLSHRSSLIVTGRFGAIDPRAHTSRWYVLGGDEAFPEYDRGLMGHAYFSVNAELRFNLVGGLSVGAFAGVGKVWDRAGDYNLADLTARTGVSMRYTTSLSLTLQATYALGISHDEKRFSFGIVESL